MDGEGIQLGRAGQKNEGDGEGWWEIHQAIRDKEPCKPYELLSSGILYLKFWDHSWLRVTKTAERESVDEGGILYMVSYLLRVKELRLSEIATR